jgi:hypothetical protein
MGSHEGMGQLGIAESPLQRDWMGSHHEDLAQSVDLAACLYELGVKQETEIVPSSAKTAMVEQAACSPVLASKSIRDRFHDYRSEQCIGGGGNS